MNLFLTRLILHLLVILNFYKLKVSSQHISDVKRLIKDKELNYDKSVRPIANQSNSITVDLDFFLRSINEVNELQQTITITGIFVMTWTDEEIAWDPNEYGAVNTLKVESGRFWSPQIYCSNTNEKLETIGDPNLSVLYLSDGTAYYSPGIVVTTTCKLDIRFYPWDRHACFLLFNPWELGKIGIVLQNTTSNVNTVVYGPNGLWNLIYSSVLAAKIPRQTGYIINIVIERQPTYILINMILPVIVLSILNLLVFFVPSNSGERLSYCITLLLAIAVFLTIVSDTLPKTSTPMAVVCYYLFSTLVISNCITVSVIYSLCLYNRDKCTSVGKCWMFIVRVLKCNFRQQSRRDTEHSSSKHQNSYTVDLKTTSMPFECKKITSQAKLQKDDTGRKTSVKTSQNDFDIVSARITHGKTVHYIGRNISAVGSSQTVSDSVTETSGTNNERDYARNDDHDNDTTVTWEYVSTVFDRICFVFYTIVQIIIAIVSYVYILNNIEDPEVLIEKLFYK